MERKITAVTSTIDGEDEAGRKCIRFFSKVVMGGR
jgi:hypothetical protein